MSKLQGSVEEVSKKTNVFKLLADSIRDALHERGFLEATEPQKKAIPLILQGYNVLLIAPTGTGKTEAAILPIFSMFLSLKNDKKLEPGIYILYITPLRALNRDLLDRLTWWGEKLGISVAVRHGDTEQSERTKQAKKPPELLITTPETLQALLSGRRMRAHLSKVHWVIVDEVHELAEDKRGSQLTLALERLRLVCNRDFQIVGLSATIGSPQEVAHFLVGANRDVRIVKVSVTRLMKLKVVFPKPMQEDYELSLKLYTHPEVAARLRYIKSLIEKHRSALLFVNTRAIAEVLASRFHVWDVNFPISVHHGSLAKPSRIAAEKGLKSGELKALVSTSSLELGIDIGHVDLVIQYMSPRQVTRLVQRVGRSGHRIGGIAKGIIITADPDDTLEAMVICRKALNEELEPISIPKKPLDVLNHQIVALFMLKSRWTIDEILSLYGRAYPYKDLTKDDLLFVLRYMHSRYPRLAWLSEEDGVVLKPRRSREMYQYFFEELSMIPDERHYLVINHEDNTPIGLLDEAFLAEYGEPGIKFIFRGSVWVIKEITHDRVLVTPSTDPTGAIPSWVGEEIPVPFEVAHEVGILKRHVVEELEKGKSLKEIAQELVSKYPIDQESAYRALAEIEAQYNKGLPVPSDKVVLVETWGNIAIIHTHLGTLANRALARMMGEILAEMLGSSIGVQQDAYRIVLQLPKRLKPSSFRNVFRKLYMSDLDKLMRRVTLRSGLFKRRLIHVARRFGALKKSIDFTEISLRRLVEMFDGTPIYEEAYSEFLQKDIDIDSVKQFLHRIEEGRIRLDYIDSKDPSPLSRLALERIARRTELIPPKKLHRIIIEAARARLLNEAQIFICTENWDWLDNIRIKDLPEKVACPKCGSKRIGLVKADEKTAIKLLTLKGKVRSKRDHRIIQEVKESAQLIERYGKIAALVLSGRGLSVRDAKHILERESKLSEKLIELIIQAEKEALKRRFL